MHFLSFCVRIDINTNVAYMETYVRDGWKNGKPSTEDDCQAKMRRYV